MPRILTPDEQRAHLAEVAALAGLSVEHIALPHDRSLRTSTLAIHYLEWGKPSLPPLVFLHGGALTAHTWDVVCLNLQSDFRCIVPDLRGHGDTDWAPDGDYSADAYAGDLAALIRELRLEGAPLIGNSLGGMTAAHYVAAQPADEQPRALVLVDVGPEMREGGRRRLRAFTDGPREMASVDDFVERALHFNPRRRPELLRRSLLHNLRQTPAGTWTWKYDPDRFSQPTGAPPPLTVEQRWADMLRVFSPTLVVRGGRSDMFLDEDAERLAEALPNGRWIRIEGASHTVQGDQPLALTTAIRDFLKLDSDANANSNSAPLRAAVHEDLG